MKNILITTNSESKATGLPKGATISYDRAPEWMQKRYDSLHAPLSEESKARIEEETNAYIEQAEMMRERVACGTLPF